MVMPLPLRAVSILAMAWAFCVPAFALEDPDTGLKVELPSGFTVEMSSQQSPEYEAQIGVKTVSGEPPIAGTGDYLCEAGFASAPQNAGLTQAQINAALSKPGWSEMAQNTMSAVFTFTRTERFELAGATGYEFVATPRLGPDAENVRVVLFMLETPRGRTVLSCATFADKLKGALPVFRTIRDGVTPPR
jgi:hypothetical protein